MRVPDWLQNSFDRIPVSDRPEFLREIIFLNYNRAKIIAYFLIGFQPVVAYLIESHYFSVGITRYPSIAITANIILFILTILFVVLFWQANLKSPTQSTAYHLYLLRGFEAVGFLYINCYNLALLLRMGSIYPFIVGTLSAPVIFYFPNPFSLILKLISYLFCCVSIFFITPDNKYLYFAATTSTILSWIFAKMILDARVSAFLNRKIVQRQAHALQMLNAELNHRNQELNWLNQEKNEFLGIVAHDLKNPLTAIKGSAELLLNLPHLERSKLEDFLGRIITSATRMKDLISNLLDVNVIERGEVKYSLIPCDLALIAQQVVKTYQTAAHAKDQEILFQANLSSVVVQADPLILTQILDNLVSNAVKYSPFNRTIWITIEVISDQGRCSIKDEGPGLSADDQQKLFGKFARLSPLPTGGENSTGLGLSIVKRLVELLQGRVWCESEWGRGSVFILELPLFHP